jgi:hypothetical protein
VGSLVPNHSLERRAAGLNQSMSTQPSPNHEVGLLLVDDDSQIAELLRTAFWRQRLSLPRPRMDSDAANALARSSSSWC